MKQQTKFKETEIGEIPEDWEVCPIADAIEINPKRELKKGTDKLEKEIKENLAGIGWRI